MKLKVVLAITVCKALRLVSRLMHRGGTAMPGRYALKICPQLLSVLAKNVETVVITGTNGKTTCSRMVEEAFAQQGKSFFSNRSGANLIDGITTEFVINSTLFGKNRCDYAVIECDEAASVRVFAQMQPKVIVVTNLFRDQLDRFGDLAHTRDSIKTAIKSVPSAMLCLNADCSLTSSLADDVPNKVLYFGMNRGAAPEKEKAEISDGGICVHCGHEYEFEYINFGHLGGFFCPNCGHRRPEADFAVVDIAQQSTEGSTLVMDMQGERRMVTVNLPAMYNIYNAAAACAAVCAMGMGNDTAVQALAAFKCGFGRMEQFDIGAGARMMLVKNPTGCNLVMEFLGNIKERFSLVISLNDRTGDGKDISWIWDTDFEQLTALSGRIKSLIVSGDRAEEMRLRLKYAGFDENAIVTERDCEKLVEWMKDEDCPVFIMPTYSAMLDIRQVIVKHCGGSEFWE